MSFIDELYEEPPEQPSKEDIAFGWYDMTYVSKAVDAIKGACLGNRKARRLKAFLTFRHDCDSGYYVRVHTENINDFFWEYYCKWFHNGDSSKRTYDGWCRPERLIDAQHTTLFYSRPTDVFPTYIVDRMIIAIQTKLVEEGLSKECLDFKKFKYTYKWPRRLTGFWSPKLTDFVERTEYTIEFCITW